MWILTSSVVLHQSSYFISGLERLSNYTRNTTSSVANDSQISNTTNKTSILNGTVPPEYVNGTILGNFELRPKNLFIGEVAYCH